MRGLLGCQLRKLIHHPALPLLLGATVLLTVPLLAPLREASGWQLFAHGDVARIGGAVGFIGGYPDLRDPVASAARSSFALTPAWLVVATLFGTAVTGSELASGTARVSWARGTSRGGWLAAAMTGAFVPCTLCYAASCASAFLAGALGAAAAPGMADMGSYLVILFVNALLVGTMAGAGSALVLLSRSVPVAVIAPLCLCCAALLSYAGTDAAAWQLATPVPYLFHTCSLATSTLSLADALGFGIAALVCEVVAARVALMFQEV